MGNDTALYANYKFALSRKDEFVKAHQGKYLLIHNLQFVDAYDAYETAAREGLRLFGEDSGFLVFHAVEHDPVNIVFEATL